MNNKQEKINNEIKELLNLHVNLIQEISQISGENYNIINEHNKLLSKLIVEQGRITSTLIALIIALNKINVIDEKIYNLLMSMIKKEEEE